jgi:cell division protease FtsH
MKYETIGESQINQIMEGKIPDPPEDWTDQDSDAGSTKAKKKTKKKAKKKAKKADDPSPIGGPASQH